MVVRFPLWKFGPAFSSPAFSASPTCASRLRSNICAHTSASVCRLVAASHAAATAAGAAAGGGGGGGAISRNAPITVDDIQ